MAAELLAEWTGGPVVLADFQAILVAVTGVVRGPDGRYPLRDERLLPLVEYVRRAILTAARNRDIAVIATNSDGNAARRAPCSMNWEKVLASESPIPAARLSRLDCQMRPRVPYRPNVRVQSTGGMGDSDGLLGLSYRVPGDDSRLSPGRIFGTLLSYETKAKDRSEVFGRGALSWPADGVVLNLSHDRKQPVTRFTPEQRDAAVVVDVALPDTSRGRDAISMIRDGVFRGLSVEFRGAEARTRWGRSPHP